MIPVVFVPSTPLLLPTLNPTPDDAVRALRGICQRSVTALSSCTCVIVLASAGVGLHPDARPHPDGIVKWWADTPGDDWPFGVAVGAWLTGELAPAVDLVLASVSGAQAKVAASGVAALPPLADGMGVLVVGDGTATRAEKSPGHVVDGAVELDAAVTRLLATGDVAGLRQLDVDLDATYLLDGRPAWQAVAALIEAADARVSGSAVTYAQAPHNVWYMVANWVVTLPTDG